MMLKKIFVFLTIFLLAIISLANKKIDASTLETDEYPTAYEQDDIRWGSHYNGNGDIADSACGLLSVTNAVNFLNGNFIDPVLLADYAYSIDAYNIPAGGGTWRYLLYPNLKPFEDKYGFKVSVASIEKGLADSRVIPHLENGGAVIAHVKGHFIALCGYDSSTNSYLVYDSAARPTYRMDYAYATWLTYEELTTTEYMSVMWVCLLESTISKETKLDNATDTSLTSKATSSIYYEKGETNPFISGYLLDSRGVDYYYYEVDYDHEHIHVIDNYERITDIDSKYASMNSKKTGYYGRIDAASLSSGTHYINVIAKTLDGGESTVAEIELFVTEKQIIDEENDKFILNAEAFLRQSGASLTYSIASTALSKVVNRRSISLGSLDLSAFKEVKINYYVDRSPYFSTSKEVYLGLKYLENPYYYSGLDFGGSIAHKKLAIPDSSDKSLQSVTIDLSSIDYHGKVYLSGTYYDDFTIYVESVEFKFVDGYPVDALTEGQISSVDNKMTSLGSLNFENNDLELSYENASLIDLYAKNLFNKFIYVGSFTTNAQGLLYLDFGGQSNDLYLDNSKATLLEVIYSTPKVLSLYKTEDADKIKHYRLDYYLINDGIPTPYYQEEAHKIIHLVDSPTCTQAGHDLHYCVVCGEHIEGVEIAALGHVNELYDEYFYNDYEHWHLCDRCLEEFDIEEHEFELGFNSKYHWDNCVFCDAKINIAEHSYYYSPIDSNKHKGVCDCGFEIEEQHKFDDVTHFCKCGLKDPNYNGSSEIAPGGEEPAAAAPAPAKKSCKKTSVTILLSLIVSASTLYVFLRKRH